jgi:uncharacterized tellurite resistance protein B-like protein
MTTPLPSACFLAFASIVYADGQIRKGELEGFRRAAKLYGISGDELSAVESQAEQGIDLDDITLPGLTDWQAALTYAFAIWVAKVDGVINKDENDLLARIGDKLGLEKLRRDAARSATYDIAALPGGHKPELFDFEALETQLEKKLPGSFKRHHAGGSAEEEVEELSPDE